MPCLLVPKPPQPTLPGFLSIVPTSLPGHTFQIGWCCPQTQFGIPALPIPMLPYSLNPAVDAALRTATAQLMGFIDSQPVECPREG